MADLPGMDETFTFGYVRLKSIQQLEDLDVVNYTGLHVWTPALGSIYHGHKFGIFVWQWLMSWICLRFRNIEIKKYLRTMGICIAKYTAKHWTYFALQYWERYFFRFVSALKLVCVSDLLSFKYAYLCL